MVPESLGMQGYRLSNDIFKVMRNIYVLFFRKGG